MKLNFLMRKIKCLHIVPPTLLLAITALLSRFLGILRDHLLARSFGASVGEGIYNLDTYYAAFRIPDLLYNLLIFGAVSAAFIPIFTQYKKRQHMNEAWAFASSMLHIMLIVILIVAGVSYIFAPQLTHIIASGFTPEDFEQTTQLMRIMLISPIIFTITSIVVSIQDSFKSFFFRSIGPLFYNGGIILGIIYFGQEFGVVGVTWGVIIGAVLQLIVQLPSLSKVHYKHVWQFGLGRSDVRKAIKLIIPRVLGLSLNQLTLLVNTLIASFLMTGSITIFYLADNLQALPLGIIAISFAITSFATLSELATESSTKPFANEIKRVMQQILFLIIPSTFGMLLLREEIIDFILVAGKFSASDATLMSIVLGFLLISLFAQSLIPLLSRGFYAYHNTKTPVLTGLAGVILSVGGSYLFAIQMNYGIAGIAVAFSSGAILNFILLYIFMYQKLSEKILDWVNIFKMFVSSVIMYYIVMYFQNFVVYEGGFVQRFTVLIILTVVGAISYFVLVYFMKVPEVRMICRRNK